MFPKVIRDGVTMYVEDELVHLKRGEDEWTLSTEAAHVWRYADGTLSVQDLAAGLEERGIAESSATIWRCLDMFADAGLLERRVAPPGSDRHMSRRHLLKRAVGGAALAAAGSVGFARPAAAEEQLQAELALSEEELGKQEMRAKLLARQSSEYLGLDETQTSQQTAAEANRKEQHQKKLQQVHAETEEQQGKRQEQIDKTQAQHDQMQELHQKAKVQKKAAHEEERQKQEAEQVHKGEQRQKTLG